LSILSEHERSLAAYIAPRHHQAAFKVLIMQTPLEDGASNGNEKVAVRRNGDSKMGEAFGCQLPILSSLAGFEIAQSDSP
jgi:hypothetical protein